MYLPTLHTGLTQLLETSGMRRECPEVVFFPAYIPGEPDVVGSGIGQLVKFRLLHPETHVLFFSFLPKHNLLPKDEFGVLQLTGTEFIQLPNSKETIIQAAARQNTKSLVVNDDAWKSFSESACKALLQKRQIEIAHLTGKREFQIGNGILNPLRISCSGMLSYPHLKDKYLPLLENDFEALNQYITIPLVSEFLHWCMVCQDTEDAYLQNAFSIAMQLKKLSKYSAHINAQEVISLIDQINNSFQQLQPK